MGAVRRIMDRVRELGITVHEWPGWDGRGNQGIGQIDPVGAVLHHTATAYGFAFQALVTGRPDLRGMLCNFAGNDDGSLTVVGSGLAWHAGGGGGSNPGPLARVDGDLNRRTVGLEIVYPGYQPMTPAQRRTALVFSAVVAELFGGGDVACIRGHGEVSDEGKWDPGRGDGTSRMIDMNAFRAEAATILEDDMQADEREWLRQIYMALSKPYVQNGVDVGDVFARLGRLFPDLDPEVMEQWGTLNPGDLTNANVSVYSLLYKQILPTLEGFGARFEELAQAIDDGRVVEAGQLVASMRAALGQVLTSQVDANVSITLNPLESTSRPELTGVVPAVAVRPSGIIPME